MKHPPLLLSIFAVAGLGFLNLQLKKHAPTNLSFPEILAVFVVLIGSAMMFKPAAKDENLPEPTKLPVDDDFDLSA